MTKKRVTATAMGVTAAASVLALILAADRLEAKQDSRRDGRIVFSHGESSALRPSQLAVMDADGTNRRDLPVYPAYHLSWSPSGRFVAFQSGRDIGLINVDGRPKYRDVVRNGGSPDWSPSGHGIAYVRWPSGDIWTLDTRTYRRWRVVRNGDWPSWSPDGKWLAFIRGRDVWVVDTSTKGAHRLISHGAGNAHLESPAVSPDGRRIAFMRLVSDSSGDEESYIYIARADGSDQRRLGKGTSPAWSPTGREIAYVGEHGRFGDAIIRARLDGSLRRVLFGETPYCGCGSLDWAR